MSDPDVRAALDALIRERGEDYAGLSRLIGRNAAYIQQFVKRGTPRRLAERDRRKLARYFGVDEAVLGGEGEQGDRPPRIAAAGDDAARSADLVAVPRLSIAASAGPGALPVRERQDSAMMFPPALLRELGVGRPAALHLIRVQGESMVPTLADGDDILVDRDDGADRLRDGIYVLRNGDALLVKRIVLGPAGSLTVRSDNALAGGEWRDVRRDALDLIGRVIWAGRRLR